MKRSRPFKKRQKLNQKNHHPSWNQSPPGMPMSWMRRKRNRASPSLKKKKKRSKPFLKKMKTPSKKKRRSKQSAQKDKRPVQPPILKTKFTACEVAGNLYLDPLALFLNHGLARISTGCECTRTARRLRLPGN
jgi:hypothetical protein